jgi:cell division protein FtsX
MIYQQSKMITMNSNKSGLQKQVLSLYRKLLRNAYAKDCKNEINSIAKAFSDVNSSTFALREKKLQVYQNEILNG